MRQIVFVFLYVLLCYIPVSLVAQSTRDSLAFIEASQNPQYPNVYTFSVANEPPLKQIAGAPEANYAYFWEFGDGEYSREKNPTHVYADSTGKEKKVVISLTNNYGSGGAPRLRPKKIKPGNKKPVPQTLLKKDDKEDSPLARNESVHLFTNHSPRPGDPIVCVLSYQNTDDYLPESGRVYLFFNEKEFHYPNFVFEETHTHHDEIFFDGFSQEVFSWDFNAEQSIENTWASADNSLPGQYSVSPEFILDPDATAFTTTSSENTVSNSKRTFKNSISWGYKDLKPGEKRNIFTSLLCSKEMIIDTNRTINIRTVIVPDNKEKTREYNLEMVIQASHDPNKLYVSDRRIKKRLIKRNGITYRVRFQNMGRGPARNIRIETDLHGSLDPSTIKLINHYPDADICLTSDSVSSSCLDSATSGQQIKWMFKNIYLPGTRQDDKENRKATKGWIAFSVKPKKHFRKKDIIDARSLIYFDKNEPISTNRVRTRVEKNWSYGAKIGFAETPFNFNYMMFGATFASFHPKNFYLQPEVMVASLSQDGATRSVVGASIPAPDGSMLPGDEITRQSFQLLYMDFALLQLRRNITPFASIGAGFQLSWLLKAEEIFTTERSYYPRDVGFDPPFSPSSDRESAVVHNSFKGLKDNRFSPLETGFFLDVQGGLVNKGPSLGMRYLARMGKRPSAEGGIEKQTSNTFQVYVQMRF